MRHFYRLYGKLKVTSLYPMLETFNEFMKGFGDDLTTDAWVDYHFDISAEYRLSEEEEQKLILSVDSFKGDRVEYLGLREPEEK